MCEAQLYLAMVRLTGCVGEPDIISIRRIPFHRPDTPDSAFLLPPTPDENGEYADELMDKRFEIVEADEYEAIRYIRKAARHEGDYVGAAKGNAEYLLAKCAEEGLGRMYDREKAIELYIRAAEDGSYDAFKKLKTLPQYDVDQAQKAHRRERRGGRLKCGMRNAECGITREHNPKPKIILRVFNEGFMRNDRLKAFLYRQISFSRSPNSEFQIPN